MPNKKDNQKTASSSSPESMSGKSNREFESQGSNPSSGKSGDSSQQAGGSRRNREDDEMSTSGGRKGQFSDSDRGNESQWSPGSDRSSDE